MTHWKRPWCWERLRAGGDGGDREGDDWMASLPQWARVSLPGRRWMTQERKRTQERKTQVQQTPGDSEGQGSLACCSPWRCKESDTTSWATMKYLDHSLSPLSQLWSPRGPCQLLCHWIQNRGLVLMCWSSWISDEGLEAFYVSLYQSPIGRIMHNKLPQVWMTFINKNLCGSWVQITGWG